MVNVDKGINIEVKNVDQRTPLHFACNNGHLPIVQYLIEKGADIDAKNTNQETPLHIACEKGHIQIVECLIEKGANIEELDAQVRPTLYFASNWSKHAKNNKGKMANYAYKS